MQQNLTDLKYNKTTKFQDNEYQLAREARFLKNNVVFHFSHGYHVQKHQYNCDSTEKGDINQNKENRT